MGKEPQRISKVRISPNGYGSEEIKIPDGANAIHPCSKKGNPYAEFYDKMPVSGDRWYTIPDKAKGVYFPEFEKNNNNTHYGPPEFKY